MLDPDAFRETLERSKTVLLSGMGKILDLNPTWDVLPKVLTPDELQAFFAFTSAMRAI